MRDRDTYRSLSTHGLLTEAREQGIDPDMAIVLAERLEIEDNKNWNYTHSHDTMGGRYTFNHRSMA